MDETSEANWGPVHSRVNQNCSVRQQLPNYAPQQRSYCARKVKGSSMAQVCAKRLSAAAWHDSLLSPSPTFSCPLALGNPNMPLC